MLNKIIAFLLIVLLLPLFFVTGIFIFIFDGRPILYWSKRIGLNNKIFRMPKFRTMKTNTPDVATNILGNAESYLIPFGSLIRKYSLDELPQLLCILKGDLNFVGPRPALYNQKELISLRKSKGVHKIVPGITGWAQINGRDDLTIEDKVSLDFFYLNNKSIILDTKILLFTFIQIFNPLGVKH